MQNINSFNAKATFLEDGKAMELEDEKSDVCVPKGQMTIAQSYFVVLYWTNGKYMHRDMRNILMDKKPAIKVAIT